VCWNALVSTEMEWEFLIHGREFDDMQPFWFNLTLEDWTVMRAVHFNGYEKLQSHRMSNSLNLC